MLLVGPVEVPPVFTRPGTYAVEPGKQKTAFSVGSVYSQHGANSEPGNSDDLRAFIDRRLESLKRSWLDGIAKVVEAPPGTRIAVLPADIDESSDADATPIRVVDDPTAPAYRSLPVDQTHPHRQKEVIQQVNGRLSGRATLTPISSFAFAVFTTLIKKSGSAIRSDMPHQSSATHLLTGSLSNSRRMMTSLKTQGAGLPKCAIRLANQPTAPYCRPLAVLTECERTRLGGKR